MRSSRSYCGVFVPVAGAVFGPVAGAGVVDSAPAAWDSSAVGAGGLAAGRGTPRRCWRRSAMLPVLLRLPILLPGLRPAPRRTRGG